MEDGSVCVPLTRTLSFTGTSDGKKTKTSYAPMWCSLCPFYDEEAHFCMYYRKASQNGGAGKIGGCKVKLIEIEFWEDTDVRSDGRVKEERN